MRAGSKKGKNFGHEVYHKRACMYTLNIDVLHLPSLLARVTPPQNLTNPFPRRAWVMVGVGVQVSLFALSLTLVSLPDILYCRLW